VLDGVVRQLGYLAHGETIQTILREFSSVTDEDVRAVIAFAAASAAEDLPAPTPRASRRTDRMKLKLDENLVLAVALDDPSAWNTLR